MSEYKIVARIVSIEILIAYLIWIAIVFAGFNIESKADQYADYNITAVQPEGLNADQLSAFKDSVQFLKWEWSTNYLDSIAYRPFIKIWALRDLNYQFCRDHSLNLGRGSKGNLSMVVAIDQGDFLRKKNGENSNSILNLAIDSAEVAQKNGNADFLSSFQHAYEKLNPTAQLAGIFCRSDACIGKMDCTSSNEHVISQLRADLDSDAEDILKVINIRVHRFGSGLGKVKLTLATNQIDIDLPGFDNPKRIRTQLLRPGHLQFFDTYETTEVVSYLGDANTILRGLLVKQHSVAAVSTPVHVERDALAELADTSGKVDTIIYHSVAQTSDENESNPLFEVLYPNIVGDGKNQKYGEGPMIGRALGKDTARVNALLSVPEIKALFPKDMKLLWGANTVAPKYNVFGLYAIKQPVYLSEAPLSGEVVSDAYKSFDGTTGDPEVDIDMSKYGTIALERMTERATEAIINGKPMHKCVAIVMDGRVISAPRVRQKIEGGRMIISGISDIAEADDLADIIQSGRLKDNVRVLAYHFTRPPSDSKLGYKALLLLVIGLLTGLVALVFRRTI